MDKLKKALGRLQNKLLTSIDIDLDDTGLWNAYLEVSEAVSNLSTCTIISETEFKSYANWLLATRTPTEDLVLNYTCSCESPTSSVCMVHGCVG